MGTSRLFFVFLFMITAVLSLPSESRSSEKSSEASAVLDRAERFFLTLGSGDYPASWELLSDKSRSTIVNDVYRAYREMRGNVQRESIVNDFAHRGVMFHNYWDAFRGTFDTGLILEQSQWTLGRLEENTAEIIIQYRGAAPTRLKMFREGDLWKVGLTETFWTRKSLQFLQTVLQYIQ